MACISIGDVRRAVVRRCSVLSLPAILAPSMSPRRINAVRFGTEKIELDGEEQRWRRNQQQRRPSRRPLASDGPETCMMRPSSRRIVSSPVLQPAWLLWPTACRFVAVLVPRSAAQDSRDGSGDLHAHIEWFGCFLPDAECSFFIQKRQESPGYWNLNRSVSLFLPLLPFQFQLSSNGEVTDRNMSKFPAFQDCDQ